MRKVVRHAECTSTPAVCPIFHNASWWSPHPQVRHRQLFMSPERSYVARSCSLACSGKKACGGRE